MPKDHSNVKSQTGDKKASGDDDDEDGSDSQDLNGKKSKRRSKNDVDGRDFKCKYCDKTYLSYPALYTHMKQKHSKGPEGEMRTPPTSGRGRGRPRKNVSCLVMLMRSIAVSKDGSEERGVLPSTRTQGRAH